MEREESCENGTATPVGGHDLPNDSLAASVRSRPTPEELLEELRMAHAEAVAGLGQPFREAMSEISAELGLPARAPL